MAKLTYEYRVRVEIDADDWAMTYGSFETGPDLSDDAMDHTEESIRQALIESFGRVANGTKLVWVHGPRAL
jgi:hypothetical protein